MDFINRLRAFMGGLSMEDAEVTEGEVRRELTRFANAWSEVFANLTAAMQAIDADMERELGPDVEPLSYWAGYRAGRMEALARVGETIGHLINTTSRGVMPSKDEAA